MVPQILVTPYSSCSKVAMPNCHPITSEASTGVRDKKLRETVRPCSVKVGMCVHH